MEDGLGDQQEHIEYLELRQVWQSIGLTLLNEVLQEWRTKYPVNIAVLDSGVKENHQAFQSQLHPLCKVLSSKSFVAPGNDTTDVDGHGTFCAGVAAGYPIPAPKKIDDQDCAERFCKRRKLCDGQNLPFVGVAPFANIISYKVFHDEELDEEALACALQDLVKYNSSVAFEKKVHVVSMSLNARYHDGVRRALYDVLNDDVIVVAAACNMGQRNNYCSGNIWFPARFGNVISVGSHDNHGQPSKISSVGREVDFLAPGEEIWGPSISEENKKPSTSSEKEKSSSIEKDEGTSISAAIVSGIVALVLAFVHKEKGPNARAKISNNPVMKEILGKMATKRDQHDDVFGYGSLKPVKVFGYGAHVLWSVIESLPSIAPSGAVANHNINTKVSKFILSETSVMMYSHENIDEIQAITIQQICFAPTRYIDKYPYNYHEDKDNRQIKPCPFECLMKSTLDAVDYLKIRKLASNVKLIHLELPYSCPPCTHILDRHRKLLLCDDVLPLIIESKVQVIERLVFPQVDHIYMSDVCRFIKRLSESLLSGLKSIVLPWMFPFGVLCRIVEILDGCSVTIYVQNMQFDEMTQEECQFPKIKTVKVISSDQEFWKKNLEKAGFKIPFDMTWDSDHLVSCRTKPEDDDELDTNDDEPDTNDNEPDTNDDEPCKCLDETLTHDNNYQYPLSYKLELPKVITVAILGDAVNIHHKDIKYKIIPDGNFKCFTIPSGGTCEKDRYLGTLCASIIAGESKGLSPFVDLVYATVINAKAQTKPEWVISALEWIEREHSNVDIVVIPLGFDKFNLGLFKTINKLSKSMIIVCAASNSHKYLMPEICYPAMYGDVICVGSHCNTGTCQPSSFSPQGREIDLLVLGEDVGLECFDVCEKRLPVGPSSPKLSEVPYHEITLTTHSLSGTCVAAAHAAGFIAQIVSFALKCGFERPQIVNNTVIRELLKYLTSNFSHDPRSGFGWVKSSRQFLESPDYFKRIVQEILSCDD